MRTGRSRCHRPVLTERRPGRQLRCGRVPANGSGLRKEGATVPDAETTRDPVDPAEVGIDGDALAALIARCRREVDGGLLPSSQVAVAAGDRLVAYETFGDAAADSRYVIFSCTKAVVAGAFWLLLADGSVRLEQRVAELIPEFATNGKDVVTVRQLLLHEGGFPHAPLNLETGCDPRAAPCPFCELAPQLAARHTLRIPPDLRPLGDRRADRATERHGLPAVRARTPSSTRSVSAGSGSESPPDYQGDINDLESRGEPPTNAELEAVLGIPGVTLEALQGEVTEAALLAFNRPELRGDGGAGRRRHRHRGRPRVVLPGAPAQHRRHMGPRLAGSRHEGGARHAARPRASTSPPTGHSGR